MFKVKAIDHTGRPVAVACGTAEQALAKAHELAMRSFKSIVIVYPGGKELSASELERALDHE